MSSWSQVYIVGSDLLNELPFEALPFEGDLALGLSKATAYLPSLAIGVELYDRSQKRTLPAHDLCLVAGITEGGAQVDLPFGQQYVERLTAGFERERVHLLLGANASLDEILKPAALNATILHFVTHGAVDLARECPHGLTLSRGGRLWKEDAEQMSGPRLILISACGAGRSPQREGDGPVAHLGGAFLLSGAECVVLSDAQLAYDPTMTLMSVLQREVASGRTIGEALRLARTRVASDQDTHDPFYWALVRALGLATGNPLRTEQMPGPTGSR
jgi:CHAT domain-containing protein